MTSFKLGENESRSLIVNAGASEYMDLSSNTAGIIFASGDEIIWRGTTTPAGWTVESTDNKAIKIVSGTPGADGGADNFSIVFTGSRTTANHQLTRAQIPDLDIDIPLRFTLGAAANVKSGDSGAGEATETVTTKNTSGGSVGNNHFHNISNMNLAFAEFNRIKKT